MKQKKKQELKIWFGATNCPVMMHVIFIFGSVLKGFSVIHLVVWQTHVFSGFVQLFDHRQL